MPDVIGITAKLEYQQGSTWVEVGDPVELGFPTTTVTSVGTTSLSNTNFWRTKMPGVIDAGQVAVTAAYRANLYEDLNGLLRQPVPWRISAPDGEPLTYTQTGFIVSLGSAFPIEERSTIPFTIEFTGEPTIA